MGLASTAAVSPNVSAVFIFWVLCGTIAFTLAKSTFSGSAGSHGNAQRAQKSYNNAHNSDYLLVKNDPSLNPHQRVDMVEPLTDHRDVGSTFTTHSREKWTKIASRSGLSRRHIEYNNLDESPSYTSQWNFKHRVRRALGTPSLIPSGSRISSNGQTNRPILTFQFPDYQATCNEDVALGTSLITAQLVNLPPNATLEVYTDHVNFSAHWDGSVVTVTTKGILDADDNGGFYQFVLTARLLESNEKAAATVRIFTRNTNDEAPRFTQTIYTSSVDETAGPNTLVATVIATDKDGDKITYAFADGTTLHKVFQIDKYSGVIRLYNSGNKIEFPQNIYDLMVTATDDGSCCPDTVRNRHTSKAVVNVVIKDVNDNKPVFEKCGEYVAQVKENEPLNTNVIQVSATDVDRGRNGEVVYSIVIQDNQQAKFKIDEKNGEVKSNKVFDREGEDGKFVPLTVKATDLGEPPLEGLCTLQVQILDVNDNNPQFDRSLYSETISQNKNVRDVLFHVSASDLDSDQNAAITYSLGPPNSQDAAYFAINPDSGRVTLMKLLGKQRFNFYVEATDKGSPPLKARADVVLEVVNMDVSPPRWENEFNQPVQVYENVTINSVIETIRALSGIPNKKKVIYKLINGNTPQTNKKSTFLLRQETVGDRTIAKVVVNAQLDYEEINEYNLTIRAENAEQLSLASEMTLQIKLIDVNDEVPLFGKSEEGSVLENEPPGTKVFKVTAHDRDGTSPFNTVYYSISPGEGDDNFEIDRISGQVITKAQFDREKKPRFVIVVAAEDGAPSARPNSAAGMPNINKESFKIRIDDKNDNWPTFAQTVYDATVQENEDVQHPVITVTATDADESSKIQYQLTTGNDGGAFAVNGDTGLIYVAGAIDYEAKSSFELTLVASDSLHEANTTVRIKVMDVNDLPPKFNTSTYEVTLTEEDHVNLPKKILQVFAQDGDKDRPQEIIYFLTGQGTEEPASFRVGKTTGEIEVLKPLDRDQPHGRPQWRFTVLAADEGGRNGTQYGYAEVKVNLKDINDNPPRFLEAAYEGKVPENAPPGQLALTMTAVDYDDPREGTNAVLTYDIIKNVMNNSRPVFTIDPQNAEIRTAICCLDRETIAKYTIVVMAKDGGGQTGTGTATITIDDDNDSPPRFEKSFYREEIDESSGNIVSTDPVLTVKVLDDDLPETNKNYFIVVKDSGVGWDRFTMVRSSAAGDEGLLKVRLPLDYENETHRKGFNFTILVDDMGGTSNDPSHVATAQVIITLRDINDNPPEFAESFKNVSVYENTAEDTAIAKFSAKDRDKNGQSIVRYSLDRTTNRRRHFRITTDGTVKIHRPLDREENVVHTVKILAIDDGTPPRTATATLVVNVLDINDNPPVFCDHYQGLVMEHGPDEYTQVMTMSGTPLEMEACDRDDAAAGNGPPFKFSMDDTADNDIKQKFELKFFDHGGNKREGIATLYVRQSLDRESQKDYKIPVQITDNGVPPQTGTSTLTVIVGDLNDNEMKDGSTDIEVYLFKGRSPDIVIGRVYSDDEDDWDWPDKTFHWESEWHPQFTLNETSGQITMLEKTREGMYILFFTVTDVTQHVTVHANVTVHVINIPEEAVYKSGSMRIKGSSEEDFISIWDYKKRMIIPSKREKLQVKIAEVMGVPLKNVQIFTVMKSATQGMLDVRFAVHGSPYYEPERLNGKLSEKREEIEYAVGIEIEMIGIDECLYENKKCEGSCNNDMIIYEKPYMITAKRTGMAGVHVFIKANCYCRAREQFQRESCDPNPCYNDGTCRMEHNGARCSCAKGYDGPRCQQTSRSFRGDGYAWFAPLKQCESSHLSLEFVTQVPDGLLFYNGPTTEPNPKTPLVQDFISFELVGGKPKLLLDFGSGTRELFITQSVNLADGEWHRIDVTWSPDLARLVVDLCQAIASTAQDTEIPITDRSVCETSGTPPGYHEYLNVNGPLQLGGVQHPLLHNYNWIYQHGRTPFNGCIRNFVHNSEIYNLASAEMLSVNSASGCSHVEDVCMANDLEQQCQHGMCSSSLISPSRTCLCDPGYYGDQCEHETVPATFYNDSFVRYSLKSDVGHYEHLFRSEIQLTYRARWTDAPILSVVGKGEEYMRLEIKNTNLVFSFNLKDTSRDERTVLLPHFIANDGHWHTVRILRYGSYASLAVDGGEGKRFGETSLEGQGLHQLMRLNENQVILGTHPEFGTRPESKQGFVKACFDDFRFDRQSYHLPMPPLEQDTSYGSVLDAEVDPGCNSSACVGVSCPSLMECVDLFLIHECRCLAGFTKNKMNECVDIDECEILFPGPCLNGGTCVNLEPFYRCDCLEGYTGDICSVLQEKREVKLSMGALAAILVCVLVVLLLALVLIIYTRNRQTNYGPVDPDDDIRENIINYNDEGGGEDDTQTYDFGLLRIPIDPSGMPLGSKPGPEKPYKEPLQNRGYSPDDPDVGEFINSNLGKADDDPDALPMDDLRVYAYEGGGSDAGSLSSLASGTDDNEQDFDYLNGWGPRFQKLADMYGQGESEEE